MKGVGKEGLAFLSFPDRTDSSVLVDNHVGVGVLFVCRSGWVVPPDLRLRPFLINHGRRIEYSPIEAIEASLHVQAWISSPHRCSPRARPDLQSSTLQPQPAQRNVLP